MPLEYVSSACRAEKHETCDDHPVVLCACPCHEGKRLRPWFRAPAKDRAGS